MENTRIEDNEFQAGYRDGHEDGKKEGFDAGFEAGHDLGVDEGYEEGLYEGHREGYRDGREEPDHRLAHAGEVLKHYRDALLELGVSVVALALSESSADPVARLKAAIRHAVSTAMIKHL